MILVDEQIQKYIEIGEILVSPFDPTMIQPSSIDLCLSGSVLRCPGTMQEHTMYYENSFVLQPGEFALGATQELIGIPGFITGSVWGKSTIGRSGVFIENAGHIDPGFEGTITLELLNVTDHAVELQVGMPICQIVFHEHKRCRVDYPAKGGKYQGQILATGAR